MRALWILFVAGGLVPVVASPAGAVPGAAPDRGRTSLVSLSSSGAAANAQSDAEVISANGRYVAFNSPATNLVPGDTNGQRDIFVRDLRTGKTSRVNVSSTGAQANNDTTDLRVSISGDGRYVAFVSLASNLVPGDTNQDWDVFVRDRRSGVTSRVSVSGS